MREMGASNLPDAPSPSLKNQGYRPRESSSPNIPVQKKPSKTAPQISFAPNETGFYFIPFGGFVFGDDIQGKDSSYPWDLINADVEVGSNLGLRFGYTWKYFYLEERISHYRATIEKYIPPDISPTSVHGEIKSLNFQQSLGFRVPISENIRINLGGGVGLTKQKLAFNFTAQTNVTEGPTTPSTNGFGNVPDEWLLTYDAILGLEYQPFDHLLTGINYRWMRVEEMDHFEARDLHLLELSLGVLF